MFARLPSDKRNLKCVLSCAVKSSNPRCLGQRKIEIENCSISTFYNVRKVLADFDVHI